MGFPSLHPSGFRFISFLWICFDISANLRRHFLSNCTKTQTFTADKLFTPFCELTKYYVWEKILHLNSSEVLILTGGLNSYASDEVNSSNIGAL